MSTVNISMVKFIDFLAGLAVFTAAAAATSAATTTADGIVVAISLTAVCL